MRRSKSDSPKLALFDLDGTLADYDASMREYMENLGLVYPENRTDETPQMEYARKLIQRQPGFWRDLGEYAPGFDLLDLAMKIGFDIMVLTKGPMGTTGAWSEKVEWAKKHLPDIPVTIAADKSLVYGRVLVDDWPEYYVPWLANRPRGIVIVPEQTWNLNTEHPNATIYTGKNFDLVKEKMQAAFDR
jgi:hypothetical protein